MRLASSSAGTDTRVVSASGRTIATGVVTTKAGIVVAVMLDVGSVDRGVVATTSTAIITTTSVPVVTTSARP